MSITPAGTESPILYNVSDIVTDALIEAGIWSPGEGSNNDQDVAQWCFRKYNYMLDTWSTSKKYVHATIFADYVIPTGLPVAADGSANVTIGPGVGANYYAPQRPVKILSACAIINNTSPPVLAPMNINDNQWWAGVTLPGITSMYPTDLFYNPTIPNGQLFLWPISTTNFGLRLETWNLILQFASITDRLSTAPGYRNAMMLSLAEAVQPGSSKSNPLLTVNAAAARAAIFGNNSPAPNISTLDSGMPGNQEGLRSTTFSYRTRTWT